MTNEQSPAGGKVYAGLSLVALSTLMFEILMTRIFSVTMWYHFAFVAISVAMFGMTLGAILVYLLPRVFPPKKTREHLALYSLIFAITVVIAFLVHLRIPMAEPNTLRAILSLTSTYVVIAVPFVFSGVAICLALTRFPAQVNRLYAADLAGAAVGCILVIVTLSFVDGPVAVVLAAFLAGVGAVFFALETSSRSLRIATVLGTVLLAAFPITHTILKPMGKPLMKLRWVKGSREPQPIYEKWNSFSRVTVYGDPDQPMGAPFGWGLSSTYPKDKLVGQLFMAIDAGAGTVITRFNGDVKEVDHLRYDVTNIAHYLRPNSSVLVVGTGGGRDILSALAFQQRSVLGVEINQRIISAVNQPFGDFSGHLDRYPNVRFVNDEARSFIVRSKDRFDIVQISLIDTWAATAAGAFVLTENSLYTVEAWKALLDHLTPRGVLTVSRWYTGANPPEVFRMIALAGDALRGLGFADPRQRILIVRQRTPESNPDDPMGVGTILVSREPFSAADVQTLEDVAARMKFDVILSPRAAATPVFAALAAGSGPEFDRIVAEAPMNISAPTDDQPFFFHVLRLRDLGNPELWKPGAHFIHNLGAVIVLGALLVVVTVLTLGCIVVPLLLTAKRETLQGSLSLGVFFFSIGMGFMLVEISQMQRLNIFLGHPVYGLAVVLFSLLLSSGAGSYCSQYFYDPDRAGSGPRLLGLLLGACVIFGSLTPPVVAALSGSTTPVRILAAVGILGVLGFFMGMPFPMGMKLASRRSQTLTPWLWGINGATSVCASVLAVAISLQFGISVTFWCGCACYLLALAAFARAGRRRVPEASRVATEPANA